MFCLLMLLAAEIMIFCVVFLLNKQDIMAPSVLTLLVFIFSTCLALLNVKKWNVEYSFMSFAILSGGLLLFGITDIVIANLYPGKKIVQPVIVPVHIERWKLFLIVIVDAVVVFLVFKEVVRIAATNPWFTNIFYAYRVITSHSDHLTEEQYMNGLVNQSMKIVIVSGFVCAAFFINNVLICKEKIRKNILLAMPPLLLCMMTLFTGVRTNILRLCVFSLICGYILLQYKKNWKVKTSWKFIRILAITLIAVLILFGVLQTVLGRTGSKDIVSVASNYAGAPIIHFNQYIQDPPAANEVFGQETFVGIWNALRKLRLIDQVYSAHEEYRYLTETDFGNVYTFFRRLLQDFGVTGAAFMIILFSAIISLIYNKKIKYHMLTYKRWKIIIVYGYLYYIIAMASIDNLIHDYLNIGTMLMLIIMDLMLWFMFRFKVHLNYRYINEKRQ